MKKLTIVFLVVCSLTLAGCRNVEKRIESNELKVSEKTSETNEKMTNSSSSDTDNSSQASGIDTIWNPEKARKLNQFVFDWGQTMNQKYKQYGPNNNVNLNSLELPDLVLDDNKWQVAINNAPIVINWSETGDEESGYSLVAVYSDAESQGNLAKHVYFFTINSGEPMVLVTSQSQGNSNNYVHFKETENKELKDGFASIVKGNDANLEDTSTSEQSEQVYLGTIAYKDLDTTNFIQEKARWLGCSIEDDGTTINLIPAMSATIQNLQLYISGQGNGDYYTNFLNVAKEVSQQTGGKPVSIWSRGGDGEIVITAQNGEIIFSL